MLRIAQTPSYLKCDMQQREARRRYLSSPICVACVGSCAAFYWSRCHLRPARADGAVGAGQVAVSGLRPLPATTEPARHATRRRPGRDRGGIGVGIAESMVDLHALLP